MAMPMDQGRSFTFKFVAFPRYRYFQQQLQRLVDRWQKILDAGGLPDCISQGRAKLKEISSVASQLDDEVQVNVFAVLSFLETRLSELTLQCNPDISAQTGSINWSDFITQESRGVGPTVTVIVIEKGKAIGDIRDQLSNLPESLVKSIIIYFDEHKTCFPYPDLARSNFTTDITQLPTGSQASEYSKSLSTQIQHLLEDKVIALLDQIAAYNQAFIPRKEMDMAEAADTETMVKLMAAMRNPFVVKDLSPYGNDEEETERKPTDKELTNIAGAVGKNWEALGPPLGINQSQMDTIKQSHDGIVIQIYNMMLLWQQREGATLEYLLQVLKNVSSVVEIDMAIIKNITETETQPKTFEDRDKIFHNKLLDFVAKKTKCVACDIFTQKYGLSSSLVNEFLNDGFFGYEKKVEEMFKGMSLPIWPRDKKDDGVNTCKMFSMHCWTGLTNVVKETEKYIKSKYEILLLVKKLQFQLYGILADADVDVETVIPEIPELPTELQHELLEMPEMSGCGTIWGDLVLHVTTELLPFKREEVKNLLENYKYVHGYRTEVVEFEREDAGQFTNIEHGSGIRVKKLNADANDFKYGSLGCFVNIKPKADEATNVVETEQKLCGLTCAHCVDGCDVKVEINYKGNYIELGDKQHVLYEPHAFDLATVEINTSGTTNIDTCLKNRNEERCKIWRMFDKPPVGMPVFKHGSVTGLTRGTCVSNNYETKTMMKEWNEKLKNQAEDGEFCPFHNILITREDIQQAIGDVVVEKETKSTTEQQPMDHDHDTRVTVFSKPGDSGSVICKDAPNGESITVVSLLLGTVKTSKGTYSYSSHLYRNVEELSRRFDCIIEPAQ